MNSNLIRRILTAAVLIPLAVWWILKAPSPWFDWILGGVIVAALFELVRMLRLPLHFWFALAATAAVAMTIAGQHATLSIVMLGVVWTALLALAARISSGEDTTSLIHRLALAYWMAVWLLLFVWTVLLLHRLPFGHVFILGAFAGVWASDIAAYFAGKRFGRHKLCPSVSPGKTVEGALAGVVFGTSVAAVIWIVSAHVSMVPAIVLGVVLACTGILGDLAESAVKRAANVKDSGCLLPGHGGLLDRIDALVPAVAVSGLLWINL